MLGENTKVGATIGTAVVGMFFFAGLVWQMSQWKSETEQKFVQLAVSFNARIAEQRGHHEDRFTKQDAIILSLREELALRRAGILRSGDGVTWPLP